MRSDLEQVAQWIAEGLLTVPVAEIYSLDHVTQAIERLEKGGVLGKIAITL